ncbi:MAG: cyclic nucleotide-binding domain-containing protein [Ignavibacteriales bacterium]|nr:cyclic nucleotide-binding domain-containing protein [Ignavibacteriales bacterium]
MSKATKTTYFIWNFIILLSTSIIAFFIPFEIIYKTKYTELFDNSYWIFSVIFILDVIFSIAQKHNSMENFCYNNKETIEKYYRSWFFVDLLSAIPFDFLFGLRILRLIRLIKIAKIFYILNRIRNTYLKYSSFFKIIILSYAFLLFLHFISIGWTLISGINPFLNNSSNYFKSLYWTITTLTSFGNQDVKITSNSQMIYSIIVMLIGIAIFAIVIALIVNHFIRKGKNRNDYLRSIEQLRLFSEKRQIPSQLQKRIEDFYTFKFDIQKGFNEEQFLYNLPIGLKNEVSLFLKRTAIEKMPLFKDSDEDFINELATKLRPILLTPGDYVFRAGEFGEEMFFVLNGELDVFTKKDSFYLTTLKENDFFGEIALFYDKPRTASIRAITFCEIYLLHKEEFNSVMAKYPRIAKQIKLKIDKFLQSTS